MRPGTRLASVATAALVITASRAPTVGPPLVLMTMGLGLCAVGIVLIMLKRNDAPAWSAGIVLLLMAPAPAAPWLPLPAPVVALTALMALHILFTRTQTAPVIGEKRHLARGALPLVLVASVVVAAPWVWSQASPRLASSAELTGPVGIVALGFLLLLVPAAVGSLVHARGGSP